MAPDETQAEERAPRPSANPWLVNDSPLWPNRTQQAEILGMVRMHPLGQALLPGVAHMTPERIEYELVSDQRAAFMGINVDSPGPYAPYFAQIFAGWTQALASCLIAWHWTYRFDWLTSAFVLRQMAAEAGVPPPSGRSLRLFLLAAPWNALAISELIQAARCRPAAPLQVLPPITMAWMVSVTPTQARVRQGSRTEIAWLGMVQEVGTGHALGFAIGREEDMQELGMAALYQAFWLRGVLPTAKYDSTFARTPFLVFAVPELETLRQFCEVAKLPWRPHVAEDPSPGLPAGWDVDLAGRTFALDQLTPILDRTLEHWTGASPWRNALLKRTLRPLHDPMQAIPDLR